MGGSVPTIYLALLFAGLHLAPSGAACAQEGPTDAVAAVQASFESLRDSPSYRTTMTIESPELTGSGFDFPPLVMEVAGERKRTEIKLVMDVMDLHLQSVVEPGRAASRLDSAYLADLKKMGDQMASQMLRQSIGGPLQWIQAAFDPYSFLVNVAIGLVVQKVMQKATQQGFQLGKWRCHELEREDPAGSPGSVTSVESIGEEVLDGTPAQVYDVVVTDGAQTTALRLWTDGAGGRPRRMAMATDQGSMRIDYSDYGAPIEIAFPQCED